MDAKGREVNTVRVCGPIAKVVREIADQINGPNVTAPKIIMIAGTAFLITNEPLSPMNEKHEQQHIIQAQDLEPRLIPKWGPLGRLRTWWGWKRFYSSYSLEHALHGYWNNPYEVEAREVAGG